VIIVGDYADCQTDSRLSFFSYPDSAWERTACEALPRVQAVNGRQSLVTRMTGGCRWLAADVRYSNHPR
jgi:hypothetical protein